MDKHVHLALMKYLADVADLPNESAKTHRFAALVGGLFPSTSAALHFAEGVENVVHIETPKGGKRGRIDAYYGNAVIEFEKSLRATGDVAEEQLREYTAALWQKEAKSKPRPLVCVASDGITWRIYRPTPTMAPGRPVRPENVRLDLLRTIVLSQDTLDEFWLWLTGFLFRQGRIEPSGKRFRAEFGATSPIYADALVALRRAWTGIAAHSDARVAFDAWHKYLTMTYGSLHNANLEELFLKHTYLACIARFLVWAALSRGQQERPLKDTQAEILSGEYFRSRGIQNLVEDDFFHWVRQPAVAKELRFVWERVLCQMLDYDLSLLGQDVLKGVYQELVDPSDRHDLGEYYTPDWLCERIVSDVLPRRGFVKVLDPTCGSGSFLRAAIACLLERNPKGGKATRLRAILDSVVGIDIHPLAVTISRATYALAVRDLILSTKRPIEIPVYLADSLYLPAEVLQISLGSVPSYKIKFGGDREVEIPEVLVSDPGLFDPAIAAAAKVAADHAKTGRETPGTLRAYVVKAAPDVLKGPEAEAIASALWEFASQLADLVRHQRDSIWAFVVRNAYRPAMLREHFDVIVGNPPWLSYRYISDPDYQAEIKRRAVEQYAIAPRSQKLMTQMEIATVFLVHSMATFGREGARLAFVMPRSVLSGDQHHNLRVRSYQAPVEISSYWDLRDVEPLFKVPSCVLFANRKTVSSSKYRLEAVEFTGRLPAKDISWVEASKYLSADEKQAGVIYLGERTAISTRSGSKTPGRGSSYAGRFHQGATIVPRSFYFVRIKDFAPPPDQERLYWAETDPEQALLAKEPYKGVRLSGHVEGRFIYSTALARHVLPFHVLSPSILVLPIEQSRDGLTVLPAANLKRSGFREFGRWMEDVERVWAEKRGGKSDRESVYDWLDYQGKLTSQDPLARFLVLYNAAGSNLCAAVLDRTRLGSPFVVEHKLYSCPCDTVDEANYLAAILNCERVNSLIKPFQSVGLMGERDIEKKVLELPIPMFNPKTPAHRRLAALGADAASRATDVVAASALPRSLGRQRAIVRESLAGILASIGEEVRGIL